MTNYFLNKATSVRSKRQRDVLTEVLQSISRVNVPSSPEIARLLNMEGRPAQSVGRGRGQSSSRGMGRGNRSQSASSKQGNLEAAGLEQQATRRYRLPEDKRLLSFNYIYSFFSIYTKMYSYSKILF